MWFLRGFLLVLFGAVSWQHRSWIPFGFSLRENKRVRHAFMIGVCILPFLTIFDHSGLQLRHAATLVSLLGMAFAYEDYFALFALSFGLSSLSLLGFCTFLFGASLLIVATYVDDPHLELRPNGWKLLKHAMRKPTSAKGGTIWKAYVICEFVSLILCTINV